MVLKLLLIGYLYGIESERRLIENVQLNIAYRKRRASAMSPLMNGGFHRGYGADCRRVCGLRHHGCATKPRIVLQERAVDFPALRRMAAFVHFSALAVPETLLTSGRVPFVAAVSWMRLDFAEHCFDTPDRCRCKRSKAVDIFVGGLKGDIRCFQNPLLFKISEIFHKYPQLPFLRILT